MKSKVFSLVFILISVCSCLLSLASCKNDDVVINNRISVSMPTNVLMEFHTSYTAYKFVKVGDNYYVFNPSYNSPFEIFMQDNLDLQFEEEEQHYRTYTYYADEWHITESWSDNRAYVYDRFYNIKGVYSLMHKGYSAINADENGTRYIQKANETLLVGEDNVECVVYESVYSSGDVYLHEKYWYEKDSKLLIKLCSVYNEQDDVNSTSPDYVVTKFKTTGFTMASALAEYGDTTVGLPL